MEWSIWCSLLRIALESERLFDHNNCPLRTASESTYIELWNFKEKSQNVNNFDDHFLTVGSNRENIVHLNETFEGTVVILNSQV